MNKQILCKNVIKIIFKGWKIKFLLKIFLKNATKKFAK